MCADGTTNTTKTKRPTATATDLPPANSPTATKGWHQRHSGGWFAKTLKSTFFCGAILDRF